MYNNTHNIQTGGLQFGRDYQRKQIIKPVQYEEIMIKISCAWKRAKDFYNIKILTQ